jgi:putative intracellular protease/amidase
MNENAEIDMDDVRTQHDGTNGHKGRVLAVVTSHDELGETGYPTGWWVSELAHPYLALTNAGYEIDVASPKGGRAPIDAWSDPNSEAAQTPADFVSTGFLENNVTRAKIEDTLALAEVDGHDYDSVFLVGGYGAVYDFPGNDEIVRLAREVWEEGGVVGSICHGAAALPSLVDNEGTRLVNGRTVTGFSKVEDREVESTVGAEFLESYVEDHIREAGGQYVSGEPFQPFAVTSEDGRLVTGQQQFSGEAFGEQLVAALETLPSTRAAGAESSPA